MNDPYRDSNKIDFVEINTDTYDHQSSPPLEELSNGEGETSP